MKTSRNHLSIIIFCMFRGSACNWNKLVACSFLNTLQLQEHGWVSEAGICCHGSPAAPHTPAHHLLWPYHLLCQAHSWCTMSCISLPHPLWVCTTAPPLPHLQYNTCTPAWEPSPLCKLYCGKCWWFWDICTAVFIEPESCHDHMHGIGGIHFQEHFKCDSTWLDF